MPIRSGIRVVKSVERSIEVVDVVVKEAAKQSEPCLINQSGSRGRAACQAHASLSSRARVAVP